MATAAASVIMNATSTALIALSTANSTTFLTSSLTPTSTLALGAVIAMTATAITAGVSPSSTHPPGFGEALNWCAVAFSKKVQPMLNYVLLFPFVLVGFGVIFVIGPLHWQVINMPGMQDQIKRGMEQRACNIAKINAEVAQGKKERMKARAEKKEKDSMEKPPGQPLENVW